MNKTQAYINASRFYLTDELPADLFELKEQEILDFISQSKWEPFEYWNPQDIWELIEGLAIEMIDIHKTASSTPTPEPETNLT